MESLFDRALARIPGGVNSPVRAFGAVGGEPFFVARGEGAYVVDTDGRRYVDYVQSWGASILGHAHPKVVEAVQRAAADGTSYGAPTTCEVELAEAICERVPAVEKVRLVSSGTEAAMTAIRLARGATGRSKIVKFAGCYHGHLDALLVAAGSGVATFGLPGSAGVTEGTVADTIVVPYNDADAVDELFARLGGEVAAVLVEPVAANMGLVPAGDAFLAALRRGCDEHDALLVFDEVITGFRVGPAGAQGLLGASPDLSLFGKVVGGGLPLAAVGGRADVMDELAPVGPVYQAGTLSGNPLATAAGLAALSLLDDDAYARLEAIATRLAGGLAEVLDGAGVTAQVPRVANAGRALLRRPPGAELRRRARRRPQGVRVLLPRLARPGRLHRTEWLRGDVPEPRPRRRRARPHFQCRDRCAAAAHRRRLTRSAPRSRRSERFRAVDGARSVASSCLQGTTRQRIEASLDGGTRVLIVDDHAMLRDAMRVALELAGHDVIGEAGNGNEALHLVAELRPSVVLMDVSLPGLDGIEVTRRLCAHDADLRVVMVTMHANPALVARAVRAGACAYLTKDFAMQEVVSTVEKVAAGDVVLSPNLAGSMLRELTAPDDVRHDLITKREADALQLLADGYSTHEVASRLLVNDRTVSRDLSSAYAKLDARHRTEAMVDRVHWGIIAREVSSAADGQ